MQSASVISFKALFLCWCIVKNDTAETRVGGRSRQILGDRPALVAREATAQRRLSGTSFYGMPSILVWT